MNTKLSQQVNPSSVLFRLDFQPRYFLQIFLIVLLFAPLLFAQEFSFRSESWNQTFQFPDSINSFEASSLSIPVATDSIIQSTKPKLLPDNMSFMERGLWGEHGIFRGIGLAPELTLESRRSELQLRRTMLSIHQIGGFATLGLMIATCYYGQKIIDGGTGDYSKTKNILVNATIISYSLTAALSIFSPPPIIRRDEASTTSTHKLLAWFHVAGMIVTPILGALIAKNHTFHMDAAHVHQISGYITTALFATSMIVITF
jgi:hypothetical protein